LTTEPLMRGKFILNLIRLFRVDSRLISESILDMSGGKLVGWALIAPQLSADCGSQPLTYVSLAYYSGIHGQSGASRAGLAQ
jgi:hypothetical protein